MSSVAGMMALTGSVSGGALVEAEPGGFFYAPPNSKQTVTLTADASVSVVTASGSGFLIPTSSNYCIVAIGVSGSVSGGYPGGYYHDGGAGGSLAYYNGLTVADGDTLRLTAGPSGTMRVLYNTNSQISIAPGNQRTPSTPYCSGSFSGATTYLGGQGGGGYTGAGVYKPGHGGDAARFTANGTNGGTASSGTVNGNGGRGTDLFTGAQTGTASSGTGNDYGGGPGGRNGYQDNRVYWNPDPGNGAVRILWGLNRAFPSTNQGNSSALPNGTADYVHTP